jgi:hypothetical protein
VTWILTIHGRVVDLRAVTNGRAKTGLSPHEAAQALAKINRYNGHTTRLYSVAEHSLHVCQILERELRVTHCETLLAALCHDAHECLIGDMTSPVKQLLALRAVQALDADHWRALEDTVQSMLLAEWGLLEAHHAARDLIRHGDLVALATERRDLMHPGGLPWEVLAGIQPADWLHLRDGGGMTHDDWAAAWLERYQELRAGAYEQARQREEAAA